MIDERINRVICQDLVEDEENLWLALCDRNGFCQIDKKTRMVKQVVPFEGENFRENFLYYVTVKRNDKIFFMPRGRSKLAIYDLNKDQMEYVEMALPNIEEVRKSKHIFAGCFEYQQYLFFMGFEAPLIARFNCDTYEMDYITDWMGKYEEEIQKNAAWGYLGLHAFVLENKAYLPVMCIEACVELDLKSLETKIFKVHGRAEGFLTGALEQNLLWLINQKNEKPIVTVYNLNKEKVEREIVLEKEKEMGWSFWTPLKYGNKYYLFPASAPHIYELDVETYKYRIFEQAEVCLDEKRADELGCTRTRCPRFVGDKMCFVTGHDHLWHEYDMLTGELETFEIILPQEYMDAYFGDRLQQSLDEKDVLQEEQMGLEVYINQIQSR